MTNGRMDIKDKIWDICGILRDDGMHIGSYVEQVTVLLFLKMLDEREQRFEVADVPEEYQWSSLTEKTGKELLEHYQDTLRELGRQDGMLGEIFGRVNSQFRTPVNLRKAIKEIDNINWNAYEADVKGAAYESLLERYAEEAKGAGQYFTPRSAIKTAVKAIDPDHDETIHDPAAGTGGFLIEAYEHILDKTNHGADLTRDQRKQLMEENLSGVELVPETRRLGLMNMVLHDLYANMERANSLENPPQDTFDVILTNPPYGGSNQREPRRDDFFVETKSPELNFLQHTFTKLNQGGRCAIVVPDGVLFQKGQTQTIRKHLLQNVDLHTVLILPIGAFHPYTGVTTNILFFEKGSETEKIDFYDLRTDVEKIKKSNPLTEEHFEDFLSNWDSRDKSEGYFSVSIEEIKENDWSLNYKEYKDFDDGDEELPAPEELLTELLSLQETITKNTQQILDEIEGRKLMIYEKETPSHWQWKEVGDLCETINGYAFDSSKFTEDDEGLPIVRIRDLDGEETEKNFVGDFRDRYLLEGGELLISMDGHFDIYKWSGGQALQNQRVCRLTNYSDNILKEFLRYSLSEPLKNIEEYTEYTTVKHLSAKKIRSIEIPVPPLEEQEKIVEKLDEIFENIEEIHDAQELAENILDDVPSSMLNAYLGDY